MKKRQRPRLYANQFKPVEIAEGIWTDSESLATPPAPLCLPADFLKKDCWALPRIAWTDKPNVMRTVYCPNNHVVAEIPVDMTSTFYCRQCGTRVEVQILPPIQR